MCNTDHLSPIVKGKKDIGQSRVERDDLHDNALKDYTVTSVGDTRFT
jgi:hypothetical protein